MLCGGGSVPHLFLDVLVRRVEEGSSELFSCRRSKFDAFEEGSPFRCLGVGRLGLDIILLYARQLTMKTIV